MENELEEVLKELLTKHGARQLLLTLSEVIQSCESAGQGWYVGGIIQHLAEIDW